MYCQWHSPHAGKTNENANLSPLHYKTIQSLKQLYRMVMLLSHFTENETEAQRGCLIYCRYLEEKISCNVKNEVFT